jgi:hypothetical protein
MTKKQKERAAAKKLKDKIKQYQITHKRHGCYEVVFVDNSKEIGKFTYLTNFRNKKAVKEFVEQHARVYQLQILNKEIKLKYIFIIFLFACTLSCTEEKTTSLNNSSDLSAIGDAYIGPIIVPDIQEDTDSSHEIGVENDGEQ